MILKRGSKGDLVTQLQSQLKDLGFLKNVADGYFSEDTFQAVVQFQKQRKLNADGVVGPLTWMALFNVPMPVPESKKVVYQKDLIKTYGSPLDSSFGPANIVFIDLSELATPLAHVRFFHQGSRFGFQGHRDLAPKILTALRNVVSRGLADQIVTCDGCYVVRNSRGSNSLSCHAFGMAVDFNASTNAFNADEYDMSDELVLCFADASLEWGGLWNSPFDPMHFQMPYTRDWTREGIRNACRSPELSPKVSLV